MNQLNLIGRLTADPTTDTTPKGTSVCRYRIAIDRIGQDGADFLTIVSYGARADNDTRWLTKGRRIGVTGRLRHSTWTDDGGARHERHDCVADQVAYLDGPRRDDEQAPGEEPF